jgi:hypothetical protein
MSKYAVFVDDGLFGVFDDREKAKACAAGERAALRAEGRKDSCFVRKMTKEEERAFSRVNNLSR